VIARHHILVYSDNPPIGGVQQYNHSLLSRLATLDYHVSSIQIEQSSIFVLREKELGVKQHWLTPDFITGYSRSFLDIDTPRSFLCSIKPDLIVFSDGWPLANMAAKQAALDLKIPYVIVVGFVDPSCATINRGDGVPYIDIVSYQYAAAQEIIAVSQNNLDLLHSLFHVPESQGKVIYYGRPEEYFIPTVANSRAQTRKSLGIPEDAIVCFTSARMAAVKGYEFQIQAIKCLKKSKSWHRLYFLWAGTGFKNESTFWELSQEVQKMGINDRVKFLGERQDIPHLLDASDIYILTSKAEGMPLAIMEAMAKGLPVIASAVSGIPEELGDTGKLLTDPNENPEATVKELVDTMEEWIENDALRLSIGKRCRSRALRLFREERMLKEYVDIFNEILFHKDSLDGSCVRRDLLNIQSKEIALAMNSFYYACLVWKAYYYYSKDQLTEMADCLYQAYSLNPSGLAESVVGWIKLFTRYFGETQKHFHSQDLCEKQEWKNLMLHIFSTEDQLKEKFMLLGS
jgi:glycosyltransferase involved in cell wall biosynthesis